MQYMSLLKLYKYHKLRFFSIFLKKTLDKALAMWYTVIVAGEENKNTENDMEWKLSSAGRASALQAEGHRFEPYSFHHTVW